MKKIILTVITVAFFGINSINAQEKTTSDTQEQVVATEQGKQINVRIDGLSCPFCAYGLEKKFKKIDGAQNIIIDIENSLLTFIMDKDKTVSEEEIKKKVKQAGFTPKEIYYSAIGIEN